MPQLTHLQLSGNLSVAGLQGLSSLTNCRHLVLDQPHLMGQPHLLGGLAALQGLTLLKLVGGCFRLDASTVPGFSKLTNLQHLDLRGKYRQTLQPSQLAGMTGLQVLDLACIRLTGTSAVSGGAELMAVLPGLVGLTQLRLWDVRGF